jgi:sec-independent protein translocase protein TatC
MTSMLPTPQTAPHDDPEHYRMTVGEHLEELRRRLIWALAGFAVAAIVCLALGRDVIIPVFAKPLVDTLQKYGLSAQLHSDEVQDVFTSYLEISLICAAAVGAPWIAWQFWQFIAAGLYPSERKYIVKYIPLSLGLLVAGMLFVYFFVLPWTLEFFIAFSMSVPMKADNAGPVDLNPPTTQSSFIQVVRGNPSKPMEGQIWYDQLQHRLKAYLDGEVKVVPFSGNQLIATEYKLPNYISLVVGMLITFGLCFQLPIVVMALAKSGIVEIDTLKASRRYVYFAMAVLAAVITPGDVITATVLLMIPLALLYELGIWLARATPESSSPA